MSNNYEEAAKRRRDTGSGLSFELLSKDILDFIFSDIVRKKILRSFSGYRSLIGDTDSQRQVIWDLNYGVGTKENTDELIVLAASYSDQLSIREILINDGGFLAISSLIKNLPENAESTELTFDMLIEMVDFVILKIGPLIKICTSGRYRATEYDLFKKDHIQKDQNGMTKKRLVAYYTKDTKQGKIIVDSYYTGVVPSSVSGSHPGVILKTISDAFSEKQYGPFSLAKKYLNAYYNG